MRCLLLSTLLILLSTTQSFCLENQIIDSLKTIIESTQHDSIKVNALQKWTDIASTEDSSINWSIKLHKNIETICLERLKNTSNNKIEEKFFSTHLANSLLHIARGMYEKGDFNKSLNHLNRSLNIAKNVNNNVIQGRCLDLMAQIHNKQGNVEQVLQFMFESIEQFEKAGNKREKANGFFNLGSIYSYAGKSPKKALKYFFQSLKIMEELQDTLGSIAPLNAVGIAYYQLGNSKKSIKYCQKSLTLAKKYNRKHAIAHCSVNIAKAYLLSPTNYDSSLTYAHKSLSLFQELNYKPGEITSLQSIANVLIEQVKLDMAEKYAYKSLTLAQKNNYVSQIAESALLLSGIYESQNKAKASLEMHKLYVAIVDSIDKNQINTILTKQQAKYKSKREKEKINDLVNEKKVQKKQFYFWSAVFGSLLFLIGSCLFILHKVKINNYKKELNSLRELKKEHTQNESSSSTTSIQVTRGKKIMLIDLEDIAFFHAANRFIFLTNTKGESYIIDYTLKKLEETLPKHFLRVHNSYIVNKNEIQEITKTYNKKVIFIMKNIASTKIPSSVKYISNVELILKNLGTN